MDTMLLVVTVASLLVAAVSATVAWQVTRTERQRRAVRVAALAAAAGITPRQAAEHPAVATAPVVDAGPEVPSGLHEFMPVDTAPVPDAARAGAGATTSATPARAGALFGEATATSGSADRQHWLMGAAGLGAAVVVAFAAIGFFGSRAVSTVTSSGATPLELVALSHNRGDDGLAVSGLVRNPGAGAQVQDLEAEVRVFDAAGILIGSRAARVETATLAPGQEATFAVSLGQLATAARYRVSFRAAGTMLPHVDRRAHQPAAVTAEAR